MEAWHYFKDRDAKVSHKSMPETSESAILKVEIRFVAEKRNKTARKSSISIFL